METVNQEKFNIHTADGAIIKCKRYFPEKNNIANIIVTHEFSEHQGLYKEFAEFMVEKDISVYTYDIRGHGITATSEEELGIVAKREGSTLIVKDLKYMVDIVKKENPNKPVILVGLSIGAFITVNYTTQYSDSIDGVVLASIHPNSVMTGFLGHILIKATTILMGKNYKLTFSQNMAEQRFNNAFKPNRTVHDWMTRDEELIDEYINDPLCGIIQKTKSYSDIMKIMKRANSKTNLQKIRKDLPIFLIAGSKDQSGNAYRTIQKVQRRYKDLGIKSVDLKIYPNGRHNMFREINRHEVYADIFEKIMKWVK